MKTNLWELIVNALNKKCETFDNKKRIKKACKELQEQKKFRKLRHLYFQWCINPNKNKQQRADYDTMRRLWKKYNLKFNKRW